jgi:glycosyltransferase involved in cell wall biosynthesis
VPESRTIPISDSKKRDPALRVLVVGINYAPELTGIGPYTTGLAEHFASQGHSVRVVTGLPHNPTWRRMPTTPIVRGSNPTIFRRWHFIPRRPSAAGRMLYEATWLLSASHALLAPPCDVVIGIIPSLSGGMVAHLVGRRFRVPVGLVFQDLIGPAASQSGYQGAGRVARVTRQIERFLARRTDQIAVIADGFRQYLYDAGVPASRIMRVRNWVNVGAATESIAETRRRLGWAPSDFVCLHAGNMGRKQDLENVLRAAHLLSRDGIKIVLSGDGNDRIRLLDWARREGVMGVSFLALQPPGRFEAMLQASDVLILNQRPSVVEMALPGKLTSYFASGRPVVAAVTPQSDAAREIIAAGAGLVVAPGDPAALAQALSALKGSQEAAERMGIAGKEYARRYLTRATALAEYDRFLARLLQSRQASVERRSGPMQSLR